MIADGHDANSVRTRSDLAIDANQDLVSKDSSRSIYLSTVVTECLDAHERCTGSYVDNSGKYILRCCCLCHRGEDVTTTPIAETSPAPDNCKGRGGIYKLIKQSGWGVGLTIHTCMMNIATLCLQKKNDKLHALYHGLCSSTGLRFYATQVYSYSFA